MHRVKTPISLYIPVCWYRNFCIEGAYFFQASLKVGGGLERGLIREGLYIYRNYGTGSTCNN